MKEGKMITKKAVPVAHTIMKKGIKGMNKKAILSFVALMLLVIHPLWSAHGQAPGEFILQRWATQQGDLIEGMQWFEGDFDGDRRDDLATLWNDGGQLSMDVHASTGTAFTQQRWATQQGNVIGGMLWFHGDFNGDGRQDLATVWNDADQISIDVQASTGTAFDLQRWATKQGNLIGGMLWLVGDFTADRRDDLAVVWNDGGKITIDVQASSGTAFDLQRWATQQGDLIDGALWFVGDFNGDRADDLAYRWNDVGKITIDVFVAKVNRFLYLPIVVRH
jgi:hypothetical protein